MELGRKMLEQCGGLPLAIVVLRELLSRKQAVFEWEAMHNNVKTYINKGKLFELQGSQISGISWVLALRYDELPYQLKPCFLHFANFPEDHEIKVRELCQLWMAEGFVPSEEIGYECLHELVQRCMVLQGKLGSIDGRIKTCRIHDLMRDLCLSKAQEESFVKVSDCFDKQEAMCSLSSSKVRRIAIMVENNFIAQGSLSIHKDGCLRSLICFVGDWCFPSSLNHFRMLRVLKLENCSLLLRKEIGKLFYLRFLSFKNSSVDLLPSSICKLRHLQIFDLRVTESNLFTNAVTLRLDQLRHLFLPSEKLVCKYTICLENASNLQTLAGISTSYSGFNLLAKLSNLTKLKVYFDEDWEGAGVTFNSLRSLVLIARNPYFSFVRGKHDVIPIIMSSPHICKLKIRLNIEKLPEASQFSQELVKLTLGLGTRFDEDPMRTLEELPKLRILRFVRAGFFADRMTCSRGGFPCLQSLCFYDTFRMQQWRVQKGAMPSLRHLSLDNCDGGLTTFPYCLRHITTLEEIVLGKYEMDVVNELKARGNLHSLPGDLQCLLLTARAYPSDDEV